MTRLEYIVQVPSLDYDQAEEHDDAKENDAKHVGNGNGSITVCVQERAPSLHGTCLEICIRNEWIW